MKKFLKYGFIIGTAFLLIVGILVACVSYGPQNPFGGKPEGERLERAKKSPNFRDGKFFNRVKVELAPSVGKMFDILSRSLFGDGKTEPDTNIPVIPIEKSAFDNPPEDGLRITWLGHSTVIIEINGATILTDPIWSERCSPFESVGPKRFCPPPIPMEKLPKIDAVIISHDHYDHLDMVTVIALASMGAKFYVPLGVGAHFDEWDIPPDRVIELDWWESSAVNDEVTIYSTPARHFSRRTLLGGNNPTLWQSAVVKGKNHSIFFSGDTGMTDDFIAIGERFGPFDLTLMKIGAYDVAWPDVHINPEEAVAAFITLDGGLFVPIHWGTFNLAMHDWFEPPNRLLKEAALKGVPVAIPRPGQIFTIDNPPKLERWWDDVK